MLGLDIAVGFAILGFLIIGGGFVQSVRKKDRAANLNAQAELARKKGQDNARRMEVKDSMRCAECTKPTNPEVDIFTDGSWWHESCYKKLLGETGE